MRFIVMFVTAVCVLFLIKLRWPKKKNFYVIELWNLSTRRFSGDGDVYKRASLGKRAPSFPPKSKLKQRSIFATATHSKPVSKAWKKPVKMSFREPREMLLLAYDSKIISDEEFLVLWESCRSKNPDFPYSSYARFDLENVDESECLAEFKNKTSLCWQTFFNYQWTSIVHKEQSVIHTYIHTYFIW